MKITVAGGTGLVGQSILTELRHHPEYELHSLSRTGRRPTSIPGVTYHAVNLLADTLWQQLIETSDWVIDCVGILFENRRKQITYQTSSVLPAKKLIDTLANTSGNFLYVSANYAPFFLKDYLATKKEVELYAYSRLGQRAVCVFPGIVYSKKRLSNYYPARIIANLIRTRCFNWLTKIRPISSQAFAHEILNIITGLPSPLRKRIP